MSKSAYTLVELLVVLGIIAVLAAVTVPYFREYSVKSRLTSTIPLINSLKLLVSEYRDLNGDWPNDISNINLDFDSYDSDLVSQIDILSDQGILNCNNFSPGPYTSNMCIALELNSGIVPDVSAPILLLLAIDDGDITSWVCVTANSAFSNNHIPAEYLPGDCRAS